MFVGFVDRNWGRVYVRAEEVVAVLSYSETESFVFVANDISYSLASPVADLLRQLKLAGRKVIKFDSPISDGSTSFVAVTGSEASPR